VLRACFSTVFEALPNNYGVQSKLPMSAAEGKADIRPNSRNVCSSTPNCDIGAREPNARSGLPAPRKPHL
jgi:hypothetical protein